MSSSGWGQVPLPSDRHATSDRAVADYGTRHYHIYCTPLREEGRGAREDGEVRILLLLLLIILIMIYNQLLLLLLVIIATFADLLVVIIIINIIIILLLLLLSLLLLLLLLLIIATFADLGGAGAASHIYIYIYIHTYMHTHMYNIIGRSFPMQRLPARNRAATVGFS